MVHTTDEIVVDPQGQSMVVDIFDMNAVSVTCYTARGGSSAFTLPTTITEATSFYLTAGGYYDVSAKLGGVEIAGVGGTKARVQAAQGVPVRVTPIIDQLEQLAAAASSGGSVAVKDEGTTVLATASALDFVGAGVTATDGGSGKATVTIPGAPVSSFNTRTGAVTLTKADVTGTGLAASDVSAEPTLTSGGRWAATTAYTVGKLVSYNGDRYICSTAHTSGSTFDATKFIRISNLLQWWHVDDFGAVGDGQAIFDAAITSGSAALSSTSGKWVAGDVGKPITVHGAGATADNVACPLVTTISAFTDSNHITLAATASNTAPSGATACWGTDDTAAIQAAINAACVQTTVGGNQGPNKILFRNAIYVIAGAYSGVVGQLSFPTFSESTDGPVGIELCGSGATAGSEYYSGGTIPSGVTIPMTGTILWSLKTCIGNGSAPGLLYAGAAFNNVNIILRDMTFRAFAPNGMKLINLGGAACAELRGTVVIDIANKEPLNCSTFGLQTALIMPTVNNGAWSEIDGLVIYGGHTGVLVSEHTHIRSASIFKCYVAVVSDAANHGWSFGRLAIQACVYALAAGGATAAQSIPGTVGASTFSGVQLDTERNGAGWYAHIYDILDPANNLTGFIGGLAGGQVGGASGFNMSGATGVIIPRSAVSPVGIVTSGALSTQTLVSGTAAQVSTVRDVELHTPVTFNPTAGAAATCQVELSPDGTTYSTLTTWTVPLGVTFDGTIQDVVVRVPAAWRVRLTVTNGTLAASTYY